MSDASAASWRQPVQDRIRAAGAVAILRMRDHREAVAVGVALAEAGVTAMEVTLDHADAAQTIRDLGKELPDTTLIGAGTVRTAAQVEEAAQAGARFCVSPHVSTEVVRAALGAELEPLPGAGTATEVSVAWDAGARLVKLFPAGPLGVGYLRAMRGPFRDVGFVPTGGIAHDQVADWLRAGASAVGLGSDLVPSEPGREDISRIAERARVVVRQVAEVRGE